MLVYEHGLGYVATVKLLSLLPSCHFLVTSFVPPRQVEEAETRSHGPPNRKRIEEFQCNHRLVIGFDSHRQAQFCYQKVWPLCSWLLCKLQKHGNFRFRSAPASAMCNTTMSHRIAICTSSRRLSCITQWLVSVPIGVVGFFEIMAQPSSNHHLLSEWWSMAAITFLSGWNYRWTQPEDVMDFDNLNPLIRKFYILSVDVSMYRSLNSSIVKILRFCC